MRLHFLKFYNGEFTNAYFPGAKFDALPYPSNERNGYATHFLGKWDLGHHSPFFLPTARGFDTFVGSLNEGSGNMFILQS